MVSVMEAVDQLRGAIRIVSGDGGTRVEILLPAGPDEELSAGLLGNMGFSRP
jgi:hypothetical protein